jgi:hypothetical protein
MARAAVFVNDPDSSAAALIAGVLAGRQGLNLADSAAFFLLRGGS